MAFQPEVPVWREGVYQYEADDPIQGGTLESGGIDNKPIRDLADRTAYLKEEADSADGGALLYSHSNFI